MPVVTKTSLKTGGWGSPKIDIKSPSLYLPLWRPDMVARGGSIASGTGTMAVTPLTLSVGANSITALTAGTFIITVPQAGTCASGTATITGSPVTLNAGVSTTVTTGVTTGTFTVTTSNIIKSKDFTGHLATITGALWTPQGRTFSGDDSIDCGSAASLVSTKSITIIVWTKISSLGEYKGLVSRQVDANNRFALTTAGAASNYRFYFALKIGVEHNTFAASNTAPVVEQWYNVAAVVQAGVRMDSFVNGQVEGGRTTTYEADLNAATIIGTLGGGFWNGTIGEVWIYNRALSAVGIQHIYLATKWRYIS